MITAMTARLASNTACLSAAVYFCEEVVNGLIQNAINHGFCSVRVNVIDMEDANSILNHPTTWNKVRGILTLHGYDVRIAGADYEFDVFWDDPAEVDEEALCALGIMWGDGRNEEA